MKSRPEYRSVFSAPSMLYRALHIISTQKYRLPVRRYILDLFTVGLNPDVVKALVDCASSLKAPPSFKVEEPVSRVVSMFGRPPRTRHASDSDDEDEDELGSEETRTTFVQERPAISLRPVSRIVGFAA